MVVTTKCGVGIIPRNVVGGPFLWSGSILKVFNDVWSLTQSVILENCGLFRYIDIRQFLP